VVVTLPKDEEVANALVIRESDFSGAFKNPGAAAKSPETPKSPSAAAADFEHPIKPTLIATPQDAQLKAAIQYLQGAKGQGRSGGTAD